MQTLHTDPEGTCAINPENMHTALFVHGDGEKYTCYYYRHGRIRVSHNYLTDDNEYIYTNGKIIAENESFLDFISRMAPDATNIFSFTDALDYSACDKLANTSSRLVYEPQVLMASQALSNLADNTFVYTLGDAFCHIDASDGIFETLESGYFSQGHNYDARSQTITIAITGDKDYLLFAGLMNQIKIKMGIVKTVNREDFLFLNATAFPIVALERKVNFITKIWQLARNTIIPKKWTGIFEKDYPELILKIGEEEHLILRSAFKNYKDVDVTIDIDHNYRLMIKLEDIETKESLYYDHVTRRLSPFPPSSIFTPEAIRVLFGK